jgi:hypothetical protein
MQDCEGSSRLAGSTNGPLRDGSGAPPSRSLVEALTNPAAVYPSPAALLADSELSPLQKRTALAGWARDALALEAVAADALELLETSRLDEVIEALGQVDGRMADEYPRALTYLRGQTRRRRAAPGGPR